VKEEAVIRNSHHGLTHPIVFCDKMTRFADCGRAVDVTYLASIKVLILSPTVWMVGLRGHVLSRGQYHKGYQRGVSWDLLCSASLSVTQRRGQKAFS